jgi:hypothetical protein
MATKNLVCGECNSEFTIKHSMDSKHYKPAYCVFCGTEIDTELEVDYRDLESDDNE